MLETLKTDKVMISLPNPLKKELLEFSKEFKIPKSKLIAQALDLYFDKLDLELAKRRISEKNPRITLDAMKDFVDEL